MSVNDITTLESNNAYPIILMPPKFKEYVSYCNNSNNENEIRKKIITFYKFSEPEKPIEPKKPLMPYQTLDFKIIKKKRISPFFLGRFIGFILTSLFLLGIGSQLGNSTRVPGEGLLIILFIILLILSITCFFLMISSLKLETVERKVGLSQTEKNELQEKHEKDLRFYNEEYNNYYKVCKVLNEDYTTRISLFNQKINKIKNEFIINQSKEHYKVTTAPFRASTNEILKGKTEIEFLEKYLLNEFNKNIQIDMALGNKANPYYPDFVYNDGDLYIDIEIDEPYDLKNKRPIHFIGGDDEIRNNFFINSNWFVIRFAEEQIIKYPKECIQTIKYFISGVKSIETSTYTSNNLPKINRWTYEESFLYAKNNMRL